MPLPPDDVGQEGAPTGGGDGTTETVAPETGPDGGVRDGGVSRATVGEVVQTNAALSVFHRAVEKAGMTAQLVDASATLTVFAPTDDAFKAMLIELGVSEGLDGLSREQLQPIIRYHLVPMRVSASDLVAMAGQTKLSAQGGRISVAVERQTLLLDEAASVTKADVEASNGVVHVIDHVLLPSVADVLTTSSTLTSFTAALALADDATPSPRLGALLDDDGRSLTVFAPDDRGFEKFLNHRARSAAITGLDSFRPDQLVPLMRYHVLERLVLAEGLAPARTLESLGGTLSSLQTAASLEVDDASVVTADLYCSNGVIHVVNGVLLPSITDVVTTDERFRALAAAMTAADAEPTLTRWVAGALDSPNEFTFFAPSDQAFNAFGALPPGPALAKTLFFHAVPGVPMSAARLSAFQLPVSLITSIDQPLVMSSSGHPPLITLSDGASAPASVTQADLFTANGVIHVIDRVLVPSP